jgi:hypothetical protein
MSDYKIEKKVPIPNKLYTKQPKWPFREMEIGDSFVLPESEVKNARSSAYQLHIRTGLKFIIRLNRDNGEYRCWRIE